ncbi:hypothetical protein ANN_25233 [Periplaneta americana]|uniref:Uncharacterized protein n=1 Tax=Periplaneta americana TaxID=6978 RepID=A0ABQ8S116_PERAM|nr:hypothetical protein ANN_25233 [Periplaneta americana]
MAGLCESANEPPGSLKASYDGWINFENETQDRQEWRNAICEREGKDNGFSYDLLDGARTTFRGMVLRDQPGEYCRVSFIRLFMLDHISNLKLFVSDKIGSDLVLGLKSRSHTIIHDGNINITANILGNHGNITTTPFPYILSYTQRSTIVFCLQITTSARFSGTCNGTLIRNTRHHAIRELSAKSLPSFYEVHQEVHCLAKDGSSRRVDIIATDRRNDRAIIIDPTVRFKTAVEQPVAVHEEKKTIYDPTIQYFRDYYHIQGQIEVFGLLFGARGTIPKFSVECLKSFGIPLNILKIIAIDVMKYSVQILRNHLYT